MYFVRFFKVFFAQFVCTLKMHTDLEQNRARDWSANCKLRLILQMKEEKTQTNTNSHEYAHFLPTNAFSYNFYVHQFLMLLMLIKVKHVKIIAFHTRWKTSKKCFHFIFLYVFTVMKNSSSVFFSLIKQLKKLKFGKK